MEGRLYEAALKGDDTTLDELIQGDPLVLHKAALKCEDKNPLHVAAMCGHVDFVKAILKVQSAYVMCLARDRDGRNPLHLAAMYGRCEVLQQLVLAKEQAVLKMCLARDQDGRNPLHLAAMYGRCEVMQQLVLAEDQAVMKMCLARDQDGRNPLHLAAMYGRCEFLRQLILPEEQTLPERYMVRRQDGRYALHLAARQAALEKTDGGGTILHLCIKYDQRKALEILVDRVKHPEFLNAKNEDGMTIAHLAVYHGESTTVSYLLHQNGVDLDIANANGKTAYDLMELLSENREKNWSKFRNYLEKFVESMAKSKDTIAVVASLIATMAFQVVVSPPGGVWQDELLEGPNPHRVGEAIMAHTHPSYYRHLIRASTTAFVSSLTTITLLMTGLTLPLSFLMVLSAHVMAVGVISITLAYALSLLSVTPRDIRGGPLSDAGWIVFIVVMTWVLYFLLRLYQSFIESTLGLRAAIVQALVRFLSFSIRICVDRCKWMRRQTERKLRRLTEPQTDTDPASPNP